MTRNTASSTTAAPSSPSVCADVQPASLPLTIAYTASISDSVTVTAPATSSGWFDAVPLSCEQRQRQSAMTADADRQVDQEDPVPAEARR